MTSSLTMVTTILARAGGRAVNMFVFLVLARSLTLDDLGLFGFAYTSTLLLASGFDVGVRNSVAYFIGRQPDETATLAVQALKLWMLLVVPCMLGLAVILRIGAPSLAEFGRLTACLLLVAGTLFVRMMQGVLIGRGQMGRYNQSELASRVVLLIIVLVLMFLDGISVVTALWALAVSTAAASVVLLSRVLAIIRVGRWNDFALARMLIGRGIYFMIAVLLMTLSKRVSFLTLSQLGASTDAGRFYGVMRLTEVLTEVALAVAIVVFSGSVRAASDQEAIESAARSTRVAFSVFSLVTVVGCLGASLLLPMAMGEGFANDTTLFRVILVGTLCGSIWAILFPTLSAIAPPAVAIRLFVPAVVLGMVMSIGLHHVAGAHGVSWAYLTTNVAVSTAFLLTLRNRFNVRIWDFLILRRDDAADILNPLAARFQTRFRKRVDLKHGS